MTPSEALRFVLLLVICFCDIQQSYEQTLNNDQLGNHSIITTTTEEPEGAMTDSDKFSFMEWLSNLLGNLQPTTEAPEVPEEAKDCKPCACGITNVKNRIVGGKETKVNQYPWMALLLYGSPGKFYCGATLINNKYLLTAAHCVNGFQKDQIKVRLLEHDRSVDSETKTIIRGVRRIIKHSGYSTLNYNNDIALIKMDKEVEMEGDLRPVCLPPLGKSFTGHDGIVTGWGATAESGEISTRLREVVVPIMSNTDCKKTGYGSRRITENMICAGFPEGKKDSCQGDSGGPLHINNETIHHIVGVVSWGDGCARPNYPGVYSRVNRYVTWIKSNTKDACFCNETKIK